MSWHFSQALVEGFLAGCSSDGERCVRSRSMSSAETDSCSDRTKGTSSRSQSGMMCERSMDERGEELLMWFREGSRVWTSALRVQVPASMGNRVDCGERWQESLMRFDRDSRSWRTHLCLWDEALPECSVTLPKWGMMHDGVVWELSRSVPRRMVSDFGWSLPRPTVSQAKSQNWNFGAPSNNRYSQAVRRSTRRILGERPTRRNFEWMMGFPIGWAGVGELGTDRFQRWFHLFGAPYKRGNSKQGGASTGCAFRRL